MDKMTTYIWKRLKEGVSEEQVQEELGISEVEYERAKIDLYEEQATKLKGQPLEHTYLAYWLHQLKCIRDLEELHVQSKGAKQLSASVAAIKARSDIWDKILVKGQELGIVKRTAEGILPGELVAGLSNLELQEAITREVQALGQLLGEGKNAKLLDLETGPLHISSKKVRLGKRS